MKRLMLFALVLLFAAAAHAEVDPMNRYDFSVFTNVKLTNANLEALGSEEYFADVRDGSLTYYAIGMENPVVEVSGNKATVTYTAALTADAYGARGTFRMKGSHFYEKRNGVWIAGNRCQRSAPGKTTMSASPARVPPAPRTPATWRRATPLSWPR